MDKEQRRQYMREYYKRPGKAARTMEFIQRRRESLKQWFRDRKTEFYCPCGENNLACIDLHHRDPTTKTTFRGGISQMIFQGWSITRLEAEIAKCDPICANCHRMKHIESPTNKGVQQRKPIPSEAELAEMSRSRRCYWRHQAQRIESKNQRQAEIIQWYRDLKNTTGCLHCPETRYACLDYHHRDPADKTQNLARMIYRGLTKQTILDEIAKCDLVCANCHRKTHQCHPSIKNPNSGCSSQDSS